MSLFERPGQAKVAGGALALLCALAAAGLWQIGASPLAAFARIADSPNPGQTLLAVMQARGPADRAETRLLKLKAAKTHPTTGLGHEHHASRLIPARGERHASRLIPGRGRTAGQIPFAIGPLTRPLDFAEGLPPILGIDTTPAGTLLAAAAASPGSGPGIVGLLPIANPIGSAPSASAPPIQEVPAVPPPAVPEPATWALLIAGFGVIGSAMRRRRPGTSPSLHGFP